MGDAVVVSAARTAIGTARKGSLVNFTAFDLAKFAIGEALKRSGIPADDVDDIVLGEVLQGGGDIARYAAVELGLIDVPGVAHNRHCASGMAAVQTASASIRAGMDRVVIAGGSESLTRSPQVFQKLPGNYSGVQQWLSPSHPATPDAPDHGHVDHRRLEHRAEVQRDARGAGRVGVPLEHAAPSPRPTRAGSRTRSSPSRSRSGRARSASSTSTSTRVATRRWRSSPRSRRCTRDPRLLDHRRELVGPQRRFVRARHHRLRLRAGQRPRAPRDRALVGVGRGAARRHRSRPDGRDPQGASSGPACSSTTSKLVEINEAFASMAVASSRILGFPHEIVNVNGSGCSLGHPVACTGARMITTLIHELRRRGGGYGVASMCAGGGMGSATVLEVLPPA